MDCKETLMNVWKILKIISQEKQKSNILLVDLGSAKNEFSHREAI